MGIHPPDMLTAYDEDEPESRAWWEANLLRQVRQLGHHGEPVAVMAAAAGLLGRSLGVNHVGFVEVTDDATVTWVACWVDGALVPPCQPVSMASVPGDMLAALRTGRALVMSGMPTEPLAFDSLLGALGSHSGILAPVLRGTAWHAGLLVGQERPRQWTAADTRLVTELAVAIWDAVRRARSARALPESDARLRAVWEATSEALALSGPDGIVLAANPAYLSLYGYGEDEVVGHSFAIIFPDEQRAWAEEQHRAVFAMPEPPPAYQATIRRKDGSERIVEARADYVVENGQRTAMVSAIRDVTDRVMAEGAVRQSEARFRTLIQRSADAIVLLSPDGTLHYVSDSIEGVLGYRSAHLVGRNVSLYLHPDDLAAVTARVADIATVPGGVGTMEHRAKHQDGSWAWMETTVANHLDTEGVHAIVANSRNITDRKRGESEREAFAAAAAHDLRSPLTALMGQAQLLLRHVRRGTAEPGRLESGLRTIDDAARRMVTMIDELLDAARLDAGQVLEMRRTAVDLVELVESVAEDTRSRTGRHAIRVDTDMAQLVGNWDAARLGRVVSNLLDNAIKYSSQGGEVVMGLRREVDDRGRWAVLTVRDQGIGIPAADLPHILERFHRGSNVAGRIGGTGIGLAGVARIVDQHGGTLGVDSTEGEGSVFTVCLPLGG